MLAVLRAASKHLVAFVKLQTACIVYGNLQVLSTKTLAPKVAHPTLVRAVVYSVIPALSALYQLGSP